ncbi:suppressor of rasval19 [Tilletia horrida]|nr:suppressor of rasval19 [Tilletia horrida]
MSTAATSRLEDIALASVASAGAGGAGAPPPPPPPPPPPAAATPAPEPVVHPSVVAWDEEVSVAVDKYVELSNGLGDPVQKQAASVQKLFAALRSVISSAAECKRPTPSGTPITSSPAFLELLKPLQQALADISAIRDDRKVDRKWLNHLSTVAEGAPAAGWIAVEPKPGPFVSDMRDSAQFYANRVIKEFKDSDKASVDWVRSFIAVLEATKEYVMKQHTTGLIWNVKGVDLASYKAPGPAPPAGAGGPPPPPPPPPPPAAASSAGAGGMGAVFDQLNQGEGITKGLKKVNASQQTHKNPSLRGNTAVPSSPGAAKGAPPRPSPKPASFRAKKPPKTELNGTKWAVESHEGNRDIVIEVTDIGQTVSVYGCKDSTIVVKGKCNAVSIASCSKTNLVLDTVVSSVEITSSPSFAVQITGKVPTVLIDQTDSGALYLSADPSLAAGTEVITAKCSAINVSVMPTTARSKEEEGEFVEIALPEQLKHTVGPDGKLKTEVVAITG